MNLPTSLTVLQSIADLTGRDAAHLQQIRHR